MRLRIPSTRYIMQGVRGPTAAGDAHRQLRVDSDEPRREPRISSARRGFSQNGARSLVAKKPRAASVVRRRSDVQRHHRQTQCRAGSAATWDQPLQPEELEVALVSGEAPAGTISFRGAVINTLNIMVSKPPFSRTRASSRTRHILQRCIRQDAGAMPRACKISRADHGVLP